MGNHKHCRLCGQIIIPSQEDTYILNKEVFKRDVAYSNGFCEKCMDEFGLDRLCSWWHRNITYFELIGD